MNYDIERVESLLKAPHFTQVIGIYFYYILFILYLSFLCLLLDSHRFSFFADGLEKFQESWDSLCYKNEVTEKDAMYCCCC